MRKNLIKTGLLIAVLIAVLTPFAVGLSRIQATLQANDAEHVIEPMVRLASASPVYHADIPIGPVADIEEIWAIEDERTEAEQTLVAGMRNGASVLGYDEASRTFYCTVGQNFAQEEWPELELYVQGHEDAGTLSAVFVDDYSYDYPSESVSDGYRYEFFVYTPTEYQYYGIVFTGLPIVTLSAESVIGNEYVPACVSVSSVEDEPIVSMAQVHERGGGYVLRTGKYSYRIEFQELTRSGRSKAREIGVLGMEPDTDWLLIANAKDSRCVMNHLAFDLWNRWEGDEHSFMKLGSRMVEVFLDNEYKGLFQLMQRHEAQREILSNQGSLATDYCVRLISPQNDGDRARWKVSSRIPSYVESRYAPGNNDERAFELFENFLRMNEWLDEDRLSDEEFIRVAQECVDIENFMSYFLFHLMVGFTDDNILNNVYCYILNEDGKMLYHLAPWDMDWAFFYGYFGEEPTSESRFDLTEIAFTRMLDLNVMNCRKILHDMYEEKRGNVLSDEAVTQWIRKTEQEIVMSGAYLRDSEKWREERSALTLDDMVTYERDQARIIGDLLERRWPVEEDEAP